MTDPNLYVTMATAALAGIAMLTFAALAGWRGWLQLKAQELHATADLPPAQAMPSASARIEIADLKERIRKLDL